MNISNNDAVRSLAAQIPTNQQSAEQTILLDAIRNKFANNENYSGTSPPVFSIPNLKLPQFSGGNSLENDKTPSKLNQFILGQLGESKSQMIHNTFAIPNLQNLNSTKLSLAEKLHLKSAGSETTTISSLNDSICDLRISEDSKQDVHVIDLTTALNKTPTLTAASPNRQITSTKPNPIDFKIPFIDCDLRETVVKLPLTDEYCQTDIHSFVNSSFVSAPSRFGKITCLRYRIPKRTLRVDHSFKSKHKIIGFCFDTKSPDDIILASLRKFNRI